MTGTTFSTLSSKTDRNTRLRAKELLGQGKTLLAVAKDSISIVNET